MFLFWTYLRYREEKNVEAVTNPTNVIGIQPSACDVEHHVI
jgi:hypothetical protein